VSVPRREVLAPEPGLSRNRIVAMSAPRLAAEEPPKGHSCSSPGPPLFHCFVGVRRAGGIVAAKRRQHRRETGLVEADENQPGELHCGRSRSERHPGGAWLGKRRRISRARVGNGTRATASRGFKTMSHPAAMAVRFSRKTSRRRRFTRLRTTAPPRCLGAVIPRRVWERPLGRKKMVHSGALRRCPSS